MKGLKKIRKNKGLAIVLATSMVALLTGCGSSVKNAASSDTAMMEMGYASQDVYYEESGSSSTMDSGNFVNGAGEAVPRAEKPEAVATDRKLIKTVNMDVETQEFDSLLSAIENRVSELGGYIESMNTYNGSYYNGYRSTRNADMAIRIPKEQLDVFLQTVTGSSNVVRRSDNVEDVTLAYVDLESHRDALRTEQSRLLELLEKAESIEDIITIEQRLSDVRYQLESMESQLRTYDNQVDYSTVYLTVEEVEVYTPVEEETAWERISGGFMDSLQSIGDGFVEFGIWFVVNIPYMVVSLLAVAIAILLVLAGIKGVIKIYNRHEKKVADKKAHQEMNSSENEQKKIE